MATQRGQCHRKNNLLLIVLERKEHAMSCRSTQSARFDYKAEEKENHDQDFYYYVCCGKDKTGHENGLELDSLKNVFGF